MFDLNSQQPTLNHQLVYGFRSSDAWPLSGSKGADTCSCVTIHLPSAEVTEIVRERDVVTRCDGQLANFTFNRALPRRDPFLGSFSRRIQSFALQGIYDAESQHVRCVARHKPVDVLGAKCACPIID